MTLSCCRRKWKSVNICALGRVLGVVGVAEVLHHRSETHVLKQLTVHWPIRA